MNPTEGILEENKLSTLNLTQMNPTQMNPTQNQSSSVIDVEHALELIAGCPAATQLLDRIESRTATIAVVGMGYVGLPLARAIHKAGYKVLGLDVDPKKVDMLLGGECYLHHLSGQVEAMLQDRENFDATADASRLAEADAVLLCVPTPLDSNRQPDLSYVVSSTEITRDALRSGQLVVLESTTYPGTTRDVMLPILEQSGLQSSEDFFLAYSPEREDPGSENHSTQTIPKLVGGMDEISSYLSYALYSRLVAEAILVSSAEIAESAKLLENIYRGVNIALVNELKMLFDKMDIDVWQVIEAAASKPFGFQAFYPGPGLGGHCIPIDPFYLSWKARSLGLETKFIELAGEVNSNMPHYVLTRVAEALNDHAAKAVRGAKILVCGIAYKSDIDDMRETPAAPIMAGLMERGANLIYHDPHVPQFPPMRAHNIEMRSCALSPELLAQQDCVIVVTGHKAIDWQMVADHASLVVDTRDVMRKVENCSATVVPA